MATVLIRLRRNTLVDDARLTRLVDFEALAKNPVDVYTLPDMLTDLRHDVWMERYSDGPVKIDAYRRALQRAYLTALRERVNAPEPLPNTGEIRAALKREMRPLEGELAAAVATPTPSNP